MVTFGGVGWGGREHSFCLHFSALGSFGDQNGSRGSPGSPPGPSGPRFSLFLMLFGSMFHMICLCCFCLIVFVFLCFLEHFLVPPNQPSLGGTGIIDSLILKTSGVHFLVTLELWGHLVVLAVRFGYCTVLAEGVASININAYIYIYIPGRIVAGL